MAIDLSENGLGFEQLLAHIGHAIVISKYGAVTGGVKDSIPNPDNVTVECLDCEEVLFSFDKPETESSCTS